MPDSENQIKKILITGASGLVGQALCEHLESEHYQVLKVTRDKQRAQKTGWIFWNPEADSLDGSQLEELEAVIHLAGESIAAARWSPLQKKAIRDSRVEITRFLSQKLSSLSTPPKLFIGASAVGFYGNCGDTTVAEDTYPAKTFLAQVAKDWEAASEPVVAVGIRRVIIRLGMVLSYKGGALKNMLLPFKLGLGGKLGSGKQYWSWIAMPDLVRAVQFLIETPSASGAFNLTAPNPVTNQDFTRALGETLHRPTIFPAPSWVLRLILGEMAQELLLSSARVVPKKLLALGFKFDLTDINKALDVARAPC